MNRTSVVALLFFLLPLAASGAEQGALMPNRIDLIRHDAPPLAAPGPFEVGVRTLELRDPDRVDVLGTLEHGRIMRHERPLIVEVWYPAAVQPSSTGTQ